MNNILEQQPPETTLHHLAVARVRLELARLALNRALLGPPAYSTRDIATAVADLNIVRGSLDAAIARTPAGAGSNATNPTVAREAIEALKEAEAEARRLNAAAGHTVFNPAALAAVIEARGRLEVNERAMNANAALFEALTECRRTIAGLTDLKLEEHEIRALDETLSRSDAALKLARGDA